MDNEWVTSCELEQYSAPFSLLASKLSLSRNVIMERHLPALAWTLVVEVFEYSRIRIPAIIKPLQHRHVSIENELCVSRLICQLGGTTSNVWQVTTNDRNQTFRVPRGRDWTIMMLQESQG